MEHAVTNEPCSVALSCYQLVFIYGCLFFYLVYEFCNNNNNN